MRKPPPPGFRPPSGQYPGRVAFCGGPANGHHPPRGAPPDPPSRDSISLGGLTQPTTHRPTPSPEWERYTSQNQRPTSPQYRLPTEIRGEGPVKYPSGRMYTRGLPTLQSRPLFQRPGRPVSDDATTVLSNFLFSHARNAT